MQQFYFWKSIPFWALGRSNGGPRDMSRFGCRFPAHGQILTAKNGITFFDALNYKKCKF